MIRLLEWIVGCIAGLTFVFVGMYGAILALQRLWSFASGSTVLALLVVAIGAGVLLGLIGWIVTWKK